MHDGVAGIPADLLDLVKRLGQTLFEGFVRPEGVEAELEKKSDGKLRIMMFASPVFFTQILDVLYRDMFLSIGALVMV